MITITTTHGDIVVELFEEAAPISCENFRQYVTDGFFAETIFHRVIPNFMIQCGGMNADMSEKETRAPIKNEADNGQKNTRGSGREYHDKYYPNDNSDPDITIC